jgi:hypothetical protein
LQRLRERKKVGMKKEMMAVVKTMTVNPSHP